MCQRRQSKSFIQDFEAGEITSQSVRIRGTPLWVLDVGGLTKSSPETAITLCMGKVTQILLYLIKSLWKGLGCILCYQAEMALKIKSQEHKEYSRKAKKV